MVAAALSVSTIRQYAMKNSLYLLLIISIAATVNSCTKTYKYYPGGEPNAIVSILDVRPLYKGEDVTLTRDQLYGGSKLAAVAVSDHTERNLPDGLLVVQDSRRIATLR